MINLINDGNIFESKCEALVCPVNCVGVMGKGLALEFKKRYPKMYIAYKDLCRDGRLNPGLWVKCMYKGIYDHDIILFATKSHWVRPSELEYIAQGLQLFQERYFDMSISSIAFPALGCGCGGLDWDMVYKIMAIYLEPLPIVCEVYAPHE